MQIFCKKKVSYQKKKFKKKKKRTSNKCMKNPIFSFFIYRMLKSLIFSFLYIYLHLTTLKNIIQYLYNNLVSFNIKLDISLML